MEAMAQAVDIEEKIIAFDTLHIDGLNWLDARYDELRNMGAVKNVSKGITKDTFSALVNTFQKLNVLESSTLTVDKIIAGSKIRHPSYFSLALKVLHRLDLAHSERLPHSKYYKYWLGSNALALSRGENPTITLVGPPASTAKPKAVSAKVAAKAMATKTANHKLVNVTVQGCLDSLHEIMQVQISNIDELRAFKKLDDEGHHLLKGLLLSQQSQLHKLAGLSQGFSKHGLETPFQKLFKDEG